MAFYIAKTQNSNLYFLWSGQLHARTHRLNTHLYTHRRTHTNTDGGLWVGLLTIEEQAGVVDAQSVGSDTGVISIIVFSDVCNDQLRSRAGDLNVNTLRTRQSDKWTKENTTMTNNTQILRYESWHNVFIYFKEFVFKCNIQLFILQKRRKNEIMRSKSKLVSEPAIVSVPLKLGLRDGRRLTVQNSSVSHRSLWTPHGFYIRRIWRMHEMTHSQHVFYPHFLNSSHSLYWPNGWFHFQNSIQQNTSYMCSNS